VKYFPGRPVAHIADSEKRRAFVAPLFTAGYGERYTQQAMSHRDIE